MFILNFDSSATKAFAHGFVKGLAAPVMLYHNEYAPPLPIVQYLPVSNVTTSDNVAADWQRVGNDFHCVIDSYGTNTKQSSSKKSHIERG